MAVDCEWMNFGVNDFQGAPRSIMPVSLKAQFVLCNAWTWKCHHCIISNSNYTYHWFNCHTVRKILALL